MAFKSAIWQPIALVLTFINVAGAGFAIGAAQPVHAAVHATLALAFGTWALRLRDRRRDNELQGGLDAVEVEVDRLREALSELQERMDFAERMLAQRPEPRRIEPEQ